MTSYHGGKQKIGKRIADIILMYTLPGQTYIEPFCGMLGVFRYIAPKVKKSIAADQNECVIAMWKEVQKGWLPPNEHINQEDYEWLKTARDPRLSSLRGFVGHHYSFGGVFFNNYRFNYTNFIDIDKVIKRIADIGESTKRSSFKVCDYTYFSKIKNAVFYCDPPYDNSSCRYKTGTFNNEEFLDWCSHMAVHNLVFVSEYNIERKGFKKIAEFEPTRGGHLGGRVLNEKLYLCQGRKKRL